MRPAVSSPITALLLTLSSAAPLTAGPLLPAMFVSAFQWPGSEMMPIAFGDVPPTGPRHSRHARSGDVPKPIEPYHADMNGATRESADKAYRKKYGF